MADTSADPEADRDDRGEVNDRNDGGDEVEANGITARYRETDAERLLEFDFASDERSRTAVIAQNREGYAMLTVRRTIEGDELERYYGFDMALDHAAELLRVSPHDLPVPERAADMGM